MSEPAAIHERLQIMGATVAVAESLTGGRVCAALTATPGASATMRGGLVVYATDLKARLAGVDPALLAERGPVDPQVAAALAEGARTRLGATFGLGVTGVAGPDRQDGREVGTVFGAVAAPAGVTARAWAFEGDRAAIQAAAVTGCLQLLAEVLGAGS